MSLRSVQSLSAYTTVKINFTYSSITPMDRTTCTEHQCLYKGALYLYLYLYSPYGPTACTEPQCLYNGELYLYLYLYSPYGLHGLYRASVLYNGALYLYLYLYSPYGTYGLYRASVPPQGCTLILPTPLLPILAVQPVESISACTSVHFNFTYTSTPPMGRTA